MRATLALSTALLAVVPVAWAADTSGSRISLSIGAEAGVDITHFESDSTMKIFFEPVDGVEGIVWPNLGIACELGIGRVLGVSLGFAYNRRGQYLSKTQVQFRDDPFIHDLETRTVLTYLSVPIVVKAGYHFARQWVQARAGVVPAAVTADSLLWYVDGMPSDEGNSAPDLEVERLDVRMLVGLEYGVKLGRNGIYARADYEHGVRTVAYDLPGNAYTRAFSLALGYRRYLMGPVGRKRQPSSTQEGQPATPEAAPTPSPEAHEAPAVEPETPAVPIAPDELAEPATSDAEGDATGE